MLNHIAIYEFISSDRGFTASMTLIRRDVKGGKNPNYRPGEKIWQEVAKYMRCVYEVKNKDQLCCGRVIGVMREYAKKQAGELNCFENVRKNRGKKMLELKIVRELYKAAGVPEGHCGSAEIAQFQEYLGPKGYQTIVVDPGRGGVIFTDEAYKNAPKVIQLVETYYVDDKGQIQAHYDGLYSVAPIMNRSKFCRYCCKGYDHGDKKHHDCLHQNCPSRMRRRNEHSQGCPEYTGWSKPTITCDRCNRQFNGEDCYQSHLLQLKQEETPLEKEMREQVEMENGIIILPKETFKSVCEMYCKGKTCLVSYKIKEGVKHKCGHGQCSNCLEYVDFCHHECYIVSECYRENKRSDNKRKAEEHSLEAIKIMTTDDGHMVKDIVHRPITYKEKSEEHRRDLQDRE